MNDVCDPVDDGRRVRNARRMSTVARVALVAVVLTACGKGSEPAGSGPPTATIDPLRTAVVTEVRASARADDVPAGPLVIASATAITIDGAPVVPITGGRVDDAAVEQHQRRVAPIVAWAEAWAKARPAGAAPWVRVAVEPTLSAAVLVQVIGSFAPVGQRDFALIVRTPDGPGSLPLHLPDRAVPAAPSDDPETAPVRMILTLTATRATVWSLSGLEGTLAHPRRDLTPEAGGGWLATLRDDLADIVARRWGDPRGPSRPASQQTIVIAIDGSLATSDLIAAMVAVRHDRDGKPLFPDVQLSWLPEIIAQAPKPKPDEELASLNDQSARYAAALMADPEDDSSGDMMKLRPGSDLGSQLAGIRSGDATTTPSGRISMSGGRAVDDTTLTLDEVKRKVLAAYLSGLKRCYQEALRTDPTVRGTLALAFTVNDTGRATAASVKAPTDEVSRCVNGQVTAWRFAVPKDATDEPTEGAFHLELQLVPD